jgi:hypothetical protein
MVIVRVLLRVLQNTTGERDTNELQMKKKREFDRPRADHYIIADVLPFINLHRRLKLISNPGAYTICNFDSTP